MATPTKILYLCRGEPGSGKSTIASVLAPDANFSADMFFEQSGKYLYDSSKIHLAHEWCQGKVEEAMICNKLIIAVANTFSRNWEMITYEQLAAQYGYSLFVLRCENDFGNIHNVPASVVDNIRARMEPRIRKAKP